MRPILCGLLVVLCLQAVVSVAEAGKWRKLDPYPGVPRASHSLGWAIPYDDHTTAVICPNRPVPPGWVIVGMWHSPSCPGFGPNAYKIQKLSAPVGSEMIICANQPIPPGWAIVQYEKTIHCQDKLAIRIRKMPPGPVSQ